MLALSLVAGFVAEENAGCLLNSTSQTVNLTIEAPYPFTSAQVTASQFVLQLGDEPATLVPDNITSIPLTEKRYKRSAQFLVTWGSFTLFYGVIAILVYMLTTANEKIEGVVNVLVIVVSWKAVARTLILINSHIGIVIHSFM